MKSEIIEITDRVPCTLEDCEAVIARGFNTFRTVGAALLHIRDRELYLTNYATFEQYCRHRWQLSRTYAYSLIDSAQIAKNLSAMADIPTHERQIRPLARLTPELQREVWAEATKESRNPTTRQVKAALARVTNAELSVSSVVQLLPEPPIEERLRATLERIIPELRWYRDVCTSNCELHEGLLQTVAQLEACLSFLPESARKAG